MRDLIPDMAGALIGAMAVLIVRRLVVLRTPAGNGA
jgi:VanZ family protein